MRDHQHDQSLEDSLRPKSGRLESTLRPEVGAAAAAGRTDALDAAGLFALQRSVGNAGVSGMLDEDRSPVHDVVGSGGGSPIPTDVRDDMEDRLGHDFGDVRLHTDGAADTSARAVNASAYTVGNDVVFRSGAYDPSSTQGRTTLAHELTHVVQQRSGPVDGTPTSGGISVSDPSDRFERDATATAERAVSTEPVTAATAGSPVAGAGQVQRQEEEDDSGEVQRVVQRQDEEEEEAEPAAE